MAGKSMYISRKGMPIVVMNAVGRGTCSKTALRLSARRGRVEKRQQC